MPALTESEFIVTLTNFDSTSQSEILTYLHNRGIYTMPNQTAMVSLDNPAPPPATDIAEFAGSNFMANVTEPGPHHITAVLGIGLNQTGQITGDAGTGVLFGTGKGNDTMSDATTSGNNSLFSGGGNDSFFVSNPGNDTIDGSLSNRVVISDSGSGNNSLIGGTGNSEIFATGNGNNTLDGGLGNDTLGASGSGHNTLRGLVIDNPNVSTGVNQLFVTGSGTNQLFGGTGHDLLADGGTGNNTLDGSACLTVSEFAGAGSDVLVGSGGNDVLVAGTGNNQSISGDGGTDLFVYDKTATGNNTAGKGTGDTMVGGSGGGNIVQLSGFTTGQATVVRGMAGAATITFSGSGNVLNVQSISVLQFDNGNVSLS